MDSFLHRLSTLQCVNILQVMQTEIVKVIVKVVKVKFKKVLPV